MDLVPGIVIDFGGQELREEGGAHCSAMTINRVVVIGRRGRDNVPDGTSATEIPSFR
jgi:hypothetical protein